MKVVCSFASNRVDDTAEHVILGVKTAGDHLDRIDALEGELLSMFAGEWIGDVQPIDEITVVIAPPTQNVGIAARKMSLNPRGHPRHVGVTAAGWKISKLIERNEIGRASCRERV